MNDIIHEFVSATKMWYESVLPAYRDKPCILCGCIPDKIKEVADALEEV